MHGKSDCNLRCIIDGGVGRKQGTFQCILGRNCRTVGGGWKGESIVEVIECRDKEKQTLR